MPFLNLGGSDLQIGEVHAIAHLGPDGYALKAKVDAWYVGEARVPRASARRPPEGAARSSTTASSSWATPRPSSAPRRRHPLRARGPRGRGAPRGARRARRRVAGTTGERGLAARHHAGRSAGRDRHRRLPAERRPRLDLEQRAPRLDQHPHGHPDDELRDGLPGRSAPCSDVRHGPSLRRRREHSIAGMAKRAKRRSKVEGSCQCGKVRFSVESETPVPFLLPARSAARPPAARSAATSWASAKRSA